MSPHSSALIVLSALGLVGGATSSEAARHAPELGVELESQYGARPIGSASAEGTLPFFEFFELHYAAVLEPVGAIDPGSEADFEEHVSLVEDLSLALSLGDMELSAGYMGGNYSAMEGEAGVFGQGFAEEYEGGQHLSLSAAYGLGERARIQSSVRAASAETDSHLELQLELSPLGSDRELRLVSAHVQSLGSSAMMRTSVALQDELALAGTQLRALLELATLGEDQYGTAQLALENSAWVYSAQLSARSAPAGDALSLQLGLRRAL